MEIQLNMLQYQKEALLEDPRMTSWIRLPDKALHLWFLQKRAMGMPVWANFNRESQNFIQEAVW